MKPEIPLDAFLRAARSPAPDSEDGKDAILPRVSPTGASSIARAIGRYKSGALLAVGFAAGFSAHAVVDAVRPHATVTVEASKSAAVPAAPLPIDSAPPANSTRAVDIESLPTASPSSAAPVESPPLSSSVRPEARDRDLPAESVLLETARTALERGDPAHAIIALDRHRQRFPNGQLSEERETLAVYALVAEDKMDEARARTAAFHRAFPHSLQGPALDALTAPSAR
jgi:hypothetical protein